MSTKWQKFDLKLSGYSDVEREAIALEVIDKIIKRSKKGIDKNGDSFPRLSSGYAKYKQTIAGNKSSNLTLTGDMLDSIEIISNKSGKVVIGYEKGSNENAKADGNIRGTFGTNTPDESKARDFLGVSEQELAAILRKYPKDKASTEEKAIKKLLVNKEAQRLSGAVNLEDLEDGQD